MEMIVGKVVALTKAPPKKGKIKSRAEPHYRMRFKRDKISKARTKARHTKEMNQRKKRK